MFPGKWRLNDRWNFCNMIGPHEDTSRPEIKWGRASASKKDGSAIPSLLIFAHNWKLVVQMPRTRASFRSGPGGVGGGWSQCYSTSMIMVWVAATRSWSFVAPVTVTLRSPLLRPFSVPEKPF